MSEKNALIISDQLIKEALQMEFDAVEAPQQERVWRQIESKLEKPRRSSFWTPQPWSRLAAVAAIFLVVVLGGIGFFRSLEFGSAPAADGLIAEDTLGDVAIMEVNEEQQEIFTAERIPEEEPAADPDQKRADEVDIAAGLAGEEEEMVAFSVESEETGPSWPAELAGDFRLYNTVILEDDEGLLYLAGLYRSPSAELMWVKTDQPVESSDEFIKTLGELIGAELQVLEETNEIVRVSVFDMSGLAWQHGAQYQALIVTSGNLEFSELELISSELP